MKRFLITLLATSLFVTAAFAGESCCKAQAACCLPAQGCCVDSNSKEHSTNNTGTEVKAVQTATAQVTALVEKGDYEQSNCCGEEQPCCAQGADCCSAATSQS